MSSFPCSETVSDCESLLQSPLPFPFLPTLSTPRALIVGDGNPLSSTLSSAPPHCQRPHEVFHLSPTLLSHSSPLLSSSFIALNYGLGVFADRL